MAAVPPCCSRPTTAAAGLRYSTENHSHFSADASPSRLLALSDRYAGDGRGMTLCDGPPTDEWMRKPRCDVGCRVMSYLHENVATNYVCAVDTSSEITATPGRPPARADTGRLRGYWIVATSGVTQMRHLNWQSLARCVVWPCRRVCEIHCFCELVAALPLSFPIK